MRTNRDDMILTYLTDLVQSSTCTTDYAVVHREETKKCHLSYMYHVKCSHSSLLDF